MAFFDDLKRSLTDTGKVVTEKTKDLSNTVRIKAQIAAEKDAMRREYERIGREFYQSATEADRERFPESFAAIGESEKKLAKLDAELTELDGSISCPECGARVEKTACFCTKCGAKIEYVRSASGESVTVSVEKDEPAGEPMTDAGEAATAQEEETAEKEA